MPPTPPDTPQIRSKGRSAWHRASPGRSAQALLGAEHPLVTVLFACQATMDSIVVVAAIQLAALALWSVHASHARALTIGGGIVQLALNLRWATLRAERRGWCLELMIAGRGRLPLTALTRERERLTDPRLQSRLAASFDDLAARAALKQWRRERQRPMCSHRVLAAVEPQLRDVAARLRAGEVELRGVALLDRLLTDGASPLYGEKIGSLRDELARGRYLLA
jgi:hypothetical protein